MDPILNLFARIDSRKVFSDPWYYGDWLAHMDAWQFTLAMYDADADSNWSLVE